jgi:hypothetical protein
LDPAVCNGPEVLDAANSVFNNGQQCFIHSISRARRPESSDLKTLDSCGKLGETSGLTLDVPGGILLNIRLKAIFGEAY